MLRTVLARNVIIGMSIHHYINERNAKLGQKAVGK